ncbi:MAG: IclR family transcriptional regulator [Georgenia sp.]
MRGSSTGSRRGWLALRPRWEERRVPSNQSVQSVDRAIDLLEAMTDQGGDATLSQRAASGLPMPTIHRLMRTRVARGYARQAPSRRYTLGPNPIRLGELAGRQLGAGARPHLEHVARELGETVNLSTIDRDMAVYVAQAASVHSMRMFTEVGRRVFCHCTGVGKATLAQLPDATVRAIRARTGMPAQTELSITDPDALIAELDRIRAQGYAVDDGEQELGVGWYAVAVPDVPTTSAVSISGPAVRVTDVVGEQVVPVLQEVAARITAELLSLH